MVSLEALKNELTIAKTKCVIKKTIDTSSGRDVLIFNPEKMELEAELAKFGNDWIIQELIQQHPDLQALNDTSLNTFRVMTYICNEEICVCPVALRMGRAGADRDNIHYGGISIGVNADGTLRKYAFAEYGERLAEHPDSKVCFEGYKIYGADDLIRNTAKLCHERMPWLGILSWDLSVDSEGQIVLIEVNTTGQSAWFCQMVNGEPLFGENTGKMLELIR